MKEMIMIILINMAGLNQGLSFTKVIPNGNISVLEGQDVRLLCAADEKYHFCRFVHNDYECVFGFGNNNLNDTKHSGLKSQKCAIYQKQMF